MQGFPRGPEFFDSEAVVDFDRRKGVVMDAKDFVAADKFRSLYGVVRSHRKIVAKAQRGKLQFGGFADEFHVQCQCSVAGEIKVSVRAFDHKTTGIAATGAVGHRAGMDGVDELGATKIEPVPAPVI